MSANMQKTYLGVLKYSNWKSEQGHNQLYLSQHIC